jgi:radical SAM protein with 4Fe4S-binding SPASM domain
MKRIQLENRTELWNEIPLESPYVIFIDPTSNCNFKCKFCMNDKIKKHDTMKFDLYKKIIDDLQKFQIPIKTVRLYGFGEPLMNVNFCDMVRYAKKSDKVINVDTTTNGFILNTTYNCDLINSGIDRINISINGMSSGQYKEFTGREVNFIKMVNNIEHLYRIKNKTTIFIKICGDNLSEVDKNLFYKIFEPISDGCDIEYTMSCWYGIENKPADVGIYGQAREDVQICPYIFYSMMIQSGGEVSLCFLDWDKQMLIGDVNKQSVKEIWNSHELKKYQIDMLDNVKNNICRNCDQLKAGMPVNLDVYRNKLKQVIN